MMLFFAGIVSGIIATITYGYVRFHQLQKKLREASKVPYTLDEIANEISLAVEQEIARLQAGEAN